MTPRAYLDAVRKRCEAATAGPWLGDRFDGTTKYQVVGGLGDATECLCVGDDNNTCTHTVLKVQHKSGEFGFVGPNGEADEDFVRHARTDLPKLERIARLAENYRDAVRKGNIESISADETRCALFAALEELK